MRKTLPIIFSAVFIFFLGALLVHAQEEELSQPQNKRSDELVIITKEETINEDVFVSGETVEIYGTINGDLYVAGGQVTIDGQINGDILGAGGNIIVTGNVSDDIRIVGGNVTIAATVGRNVTAAGGNVRIAGGEIQGNVAAAGGNIELSAPIQGNVTAGSGSFTVMADIGGNVDAAIGDMILTPTASIGGDLRYVSEEEARIGSEVSVGGDVIRTMPPKPDFADDIDQETIDNVLSEMAKVFVTIRILLLLGMMIVGVLLVRFFPVYSQNLGTVLEKQIWKNFGIGFITLIITPIISIVLIATIVGTPIGLLLLTGYMILWYLSKIALSLWLGNIIGPSLNKNLGSISKFILGSVIVILLSLIPLVGFLIIFAQIIALGALITTEYQTYTTLKRKKLL